VYWYKVVLQRYARFSGRARRKEFWTFILVNTLITLVLGGIDAVLNTSSAALLYSLATIIPTLAVGSRRLHDTGRSGWWQLIAVVPFIGAVVLIVLMALDSEHGPNQHGPNPKAVERERAFAGV
jgi:uncharacterized membrane protein YhaH (DUF805 family)